jgi:hypothetical protein
MRDKKLLLQQLLFFGAGYFSSIILLRDVKNGFNYRLPHDSAHAAACDENKQPQLAFRSLSCN